MAATAHRRSVPAAAARRRLAAARGLLLAACLALSGCGSLNVARVLAPQWFGMTRVDEQLYVEPSMTPEQTRGLRDALELARARTRAVYGGLLTRPSIIACLSDACARRFGNRGARANSFGNAAILLSPRGLTAPMIAHEWSHTELYQRVGGLRRIQRIPRWFDEGLAVVVSEEPTHSEANWQEIVRRGLPVPALDELVSRDDWIDALRRYGEIGSDDPENLRLVYSRAGHAVRPWLNAVGTEGLRRLIDGIRRGEAFASAFAAVSATAQPR